MAGNTSLVTHNFTVVQQPTDTVDPTITLTTPQEGQQFTVGQSTSYAYSCADEAGGSGLANCTAATGNGTQVSNGDVIDTSSPGSFSVKVSAADVAGNTSVMTHNFTVVQPPADLSVTSSVVGHPVCWQ